MSDGRLWNQAALPRGFRTGPRCAPNPEGPRPHLTRFLGILDLHGDGLTDEGQPRVQCTAGSGGDSGGGGAAQGPGGFLPLGRAGGAGLGRGSGPEVRPSLGGGPPPLRGAADRGSWGRPPASPLQAPPPAAAPNKRPGSPSHRRRTEK